MKRLKIGMQRMNWKVYERSDALTVAQDKSIYLTYEKESAKTPSASVKLTSKSVGLLAGVSLGDGVLVFQGRNYPVTLSELSLLDLGVASVSSTGKVYNFTSPTFPEIMSPVRQLLRWPEAPAS